MAFEIRMKKTRKFSCLAFDFKGKAFSLLALVADLKYSQICNKLPRFLDFLCCCCDNTHQVSSDQ